MAREADVPPVVPPPESPFQKIISGWQSKAQPYSDLAKLGQQKREDLQKRYLAIQPETLSGVTRGGYGIGYSFTMAQMIGEAGKNIQLAATQVIGGAVYGQEMGKIRNQLNDISTQEVKNDFYTSLYNDTPYFILSKMVDNEGKLTGYIDVDTVMESLQIPNEILPVSGLTGAYTSNPEYEEIKQIVGNMISSLTTGGKQPTEMLAGAPFPELVAPTQVTIRPTNISTLTTASIMKALTAPKVPDPIMSEEEYKKTFYTVGMVANLGDVPKLQEMGKEIALKWKEQDILRKAYKAQILGLPDYGVIDYLREMVLYPGLTIISSVNVYHERFTGPIAGDYWTEFNLIQQGLPIIAGTALGVRSGMAGGPVGAVLGGLAGLVGTTVGTAALKKMVSFKKMGLDVTIFSIPDIQSKYMEVRKTQSEDGALLHAWNH